MGRGKKGLFRLTSSNSFAHRLVRETGAAPKLVACVYPRRDDNLGMKTIHFFLCQILILIALICVASCSLADDQLSFSRDIRPLLSENCFECHGPDAGKREADLRLDLEASAKEYAVVAGDDESPILERIASDDPDLIMPPPDSKKQLSSSEIEILSKWVRDGATYEQHWSFVPIRKPQIDNSEESGIDYFIRRKLGANNLSFSPPADRVTLLRRVTLDLTGLPPTPEELSDFLQDQRPGAYSRVVERLLSSPHYGEHMALPWLEAARYADTSGYQADWERFMWPWRTWVIQAFNDNMPFDQFTIEQLAGDMLPDASLEQKLATAFNRNHRINDEGGVIAAEYAVEYVVDRVDTTSTVWLGLTMGCSRCHDHKYDPLPQQDFYNMFALFNNVPEKGKDGRQGYSLPILDYPNPLVADEIASLQAAIVQKDSELDSAVQAANDEFLAWQQDLRDSIASQGGPQWTPLALDAVKGSGGVKFERLEDGSYLRQGANPAKSTYTATIEVDEQLIDALQGKPITGIRVDALTHPTLTGKSLAPSSNGNFVLSEIRADVRRKGQTRELAFVKAIADHSQANYPASQAIDGNSGTGWAVEGHVKKEDRSLVVTLDEPLQAEVGDRLRIQLVHASQFAQHVIGRFQLSFSQQAEPNLEAGASVPPEVVAALSQSQSENKSKSEESHRVLLDHFKKTDPSFAALRREKTDLVARLAEAKKQQFVKVMVMDEMEQPRETFVLTRGLYDQPNKERPATPNAPTLFGGLGEREHNRLGFARWLVAEDNPLTARVVVNRFWQQFFGRGIVETVEDFGSQGTPPTHPELLDWLADEFRESGWDVKQLVRTMVTSQTYQQSSVVSSGHLERDPKNMLLGRASRIRLSGYQLRDQALFASGLLVPTLGGPSVKPYQPPGLWAEVSFQAKNRSTDFYVQDQGDNLYRRSLYTFWKRSVAPPMLANFDAAGREMCTVRQTRTSTPLQALNLMNDVTFVEAARCMAERMMRQRGDAKQTIQYGFQLLGLQGSPQKIEMLETSFREYQQHFSSQPDQAKLFIANGESKPSPDLDPTQLAATMAIASVILNLDEVVTRQ